MAKLRTCDYENAVHSFDFDRNSLEEYPLYTVTGAVQRFPK